MTGTVVCVVGPSGAGKDSLLGWLKDHWTGSTPIRQARRTITRPADAGGEAHEAISHKAFADALEQGLFALNWSAHNLCYGIRHSELAGTEHGAVVLFNGSRANLPSATRMLPGLAVLHVTASAPVLRGRLLSRGREPVQEVEARIQRNRALPPVDHPCMLEVVNDGPLEEAGQQALEWLRSLRR